MTQFLIGLGAMIVIAIGTMLALYVAELSTEQAFYTRDTVPLRYETPTNGRLDHHPQKKKG